MPAPSESQIEWTTLVDDERGLVRLEFNKNMGRIFVHLTLKKWNTEILRSLRDGISILTGTLQAVGVRRLNVIIPEGDDKLYRFERLFGFVEKRRKGGVILMEKEF